jgi:uncharacterized protein with NRDE domain
MCLVAIAFRAHPAYPLIIAGNRDELHARPSAPAHWWADAPDVLGGRDLVASGSWLAVNRRGCFAVVTNRPGSAPQTPAPSRGRLVRDFVRGSLGPRNFLAGLAAGSEAFAGFWLAAGGPDEVLIAHNPRSEPLQVSALRPGITAMSNAPPGQRWPKADYLASALGAELCRSGTDLAGRLLDLLAREEPVAGPAPELSPALSRTAFVRGETYGTRASTVLLIGRDRDCEFIERRFDPQGRPAGETALSFGLAVG